MTGLHRIAGGLNRRRRDTLAGRCALCPAPAAGWIETWDLQMRGVCQTHAEQGRRLGYTVHTAEELA